MKLNYVWVFGVAYPTLTNGRTVDLGTAAIYAVLGGQAVGNTGPSVITGNVGVSPGTAITGFPPGEVSGVFHSADAAAAQAQQDANNAYNVAAGLAITETLTGQDLGGLTLQPGVYFYKTSAQLTGELILDAAGHPNAQFVFQIGSTLTTASASSVVLINGAQACNVIFAIGSSATLGTGTTFRGIIIAVTSITATTSTSEVGSFLALNGAVTLDTNNIVAQNCEAGTSTTSCPPAGTSTITETKTSTLTVALSTITTTAPGSVSPSLISPKFVLSFPTQRWKAFS